MKRSTLHPLKQWRRKLGGRLLSAYATGQYDVVLTLDLPDGQAMSRCGHIRRANDDGAGVFTRGILQVGGRRALDVRQTKLAQQNSAMKSCCGALV